MIDIICGIYKISLGHKRKQTQKAVEEFNASNYLDNHNVIDNKETING